MAHNALLIEVEQLQNILVARATGGGEDFVAYRDLRTKLMADPALKNRLPSFVLSCRDLGQFWGYIKSKFSTYQERREFLWSEFRPLLEAIENGLGAPVHEVATEALAKLDAEHAARSLNLGVDQHDQQVFKQILSGCSSVVGGLASVRNAMGDAHGQGLKPVKPAARHAQLAVNLAGSMATFLLQTFEMHHGEVLHTNTAPAF